MILTNRGYIVQDFVAYKYNEIKNGILREINKMMLPKGHPFLNYPNTPNSRIIDIIIILKMILGENCDVPISLLHKCNGVENNKFSMPKYLEGIDEILILYYILIKNYKNISAVIYEPKEIMHNGKMLEYSLLFRYPIEYLVNIEVKTMRCDPFEKEDNLDIHTVKDGTVLIKQLINDDIDYNLLKKEHPEAIELEHSTYYSALNRNIKKIAEKFDWKVNAEIKMLNIGFVCIHFSTSIEEFYTYMFNKKKGIYKTMDWGNLDALVLFVLDAKNDIYLQNIYDMGYVVTMLRNESKINQDIMKMMRLDNYILLGDKVPTDVYEEAQSCAKLYKVMKREGMLNIIPYDTSNDEIEKYVSYLKDKSVRYGEI